MNQEQITKIEVSLSNMKEKKSRLYFFVQDTKGNAKASVAYIYDLALVLKKQGYNSIILHEKPDYVGVASWMGQEYMDSLPHKSIEGQSLEVAPEDFVIIPELFGFVMSQLTKLPCGKIVLCQAYDHMLETLQPGQTWPSLGFFKCITTTQQQKEFIENVMRGVSFDILKPTISDNFSKSLLPAKPIIAIHTRDQRDSINVIKTFYLKFPQYRWITFRDMRGLTQSEFASSLKECFLSVWIDETSAYGTFPLESMKCGVPVLGLVPNLIPEWMNEQNGIWINNKNQVSDFIADFIQNWLEDNIKEELKDEMLKTTENISDKQEFVKVSISLFEGYLQTRINSFEEQLTKLKSI